MNEKPFTFKPKKCKKCGLEFDLIIISYEKFNTVPKYCPNCAADLNDKQNVLKFKKGTLKYSDKDYVVYKIEWLKEHFDTTESMIYSKKKSWG